MIVPPPDSMTPLDALRNLLACITDYKGHGMPGFTDRAQAYIAIADANAIVKREDARGLYCAECDDFHLPPLCGAA